MQAVLFGGTGFVGAHYARHLLESDPDARVLLCDLLPLDEARFAPALAAVLRDPRCTFRVLDVRQPIPVDLVDGPVDLIANFAAVHREPGHELAEYWQANIPGAENVTAYASAIGCKHLLFTSSISPYGLSELARDERSLPMPSTPYGCSKFAAEKIHQIWQAQSPDRRLLIARPGVVFGAGEGGNVTRMVKFVRKGMFAYFGNQDVRKSGIFVKELCRMFDWGLANLDEPAFCNLRPGAALFNCSFDLPPSVKEYVDTIKSVGGFTRPVLSVPFGLLYFASFFFFGIGGIHPVRMKKLIRPNLILPTFLKEKGYPWHWTFRTAFEDWKRELPGDWGAA
jgi:nucleoside-diphosphate-sugar epimerase